VAKIEVGEYVTIIKAGTFRGRVFESGSKGRVVRVIKGAGSKSMRNKTYAEIDLLGGGGNVVDRIELPAWWLRPRSVLDDFADI
jgi:hypothetical protein